MNILELIGNTPLLNLDIDGLKKGVKLYAKAEFMNVGGSVKDRAAKSMLLKGIQNGSLTKDKTIIDATSGNTGISYAMIGSALGYNVRLCIPANISNERRYFMKAYGADIIETSPLEGIDGAYNEVQRIVAENSTAYFYPNQYSNNENWLAHYNGTGKEILAQTEGNVTHFVSGTGTLGTFTGCVKRLKEYNNNIQAVIMQPYNYMLTADNALDIISEYDVVADASDNYQCCYLVNDACVLLGKPDVFGAMYQFERQSSVYYAKEGSCYRCIYPAPPPAGLVPSCATGGVMGALPGIIGTIQANEVIKLIECFIINNFYFGGKIMADVYSSPYDQVKEQLNLDRLVRTIRSLI